MRQEEVEVEEKSVERVYCDDCGTECTASYKVEPKDVCPDCSSGNAVSRVKDLALDNRDDSPISILELLFFSTLFPLVAIIIFGIAPADDDGPNSEALRTMALFTLGSMLWTGGLLLVVLL